MGWSIKKNRICISNTWILRQFLRLVQRCDTKCLSMLLAIGFKMQRNTWLIMYFILRDTSRCVNERRAWTTIICLNIQPDLMSNGIKCSTIRVKIVGCVRFFPTGLYGRNPIISNIISNTSVSSRNLSRYSLLVTTLSRSSIGSLILICIPLHLWNIRGG
jgi:hypothetical protein